LNIAIIPARGGSKRLKKKNIRDFCGKPVIAYAIENALNLGIFTDVIVTTDDPDIASISRDFGAHIPELRPSHLSDDYATTLDVMKYTVANYIPEREVNTVVCCIYPTTPLLSPRFILEGRYLLESGHWDYVISAARYSHPIERAFTINSGGPVEIINPEHVLTRTQDLSDSFYDAGQFYWGERQTWINGKSIFLSKMAAVQIPKLQSIDIDTLEDWMLAEHIYTSETFRAHG
jgi:pseudaminic acid cytidylyltransferase